MHQCVVQSHVTQNIGLIALHFDVCWGRFGAEQRTRLVSGMGTTSGNFEITALCFIQYYFDVFQSVMTPSSRGLLAGPSISTCARRLKFWIWLVRTNHWLINHIIMQNGRIMYEPGYNAKTCPRCAEARCNSTVKSRLCYCKSEVGLCNSTRRVQPLRR